MTSASHGRASFGPPQNPLGGFVWALVQLPRALMWQVREKDLRSLTLAPVTWTLLLGLAGAFGAVLGAGPLADVIIGHEGWLTLALRAVLTVVLLFAVVLALWQVQGALSAPALERMALYVQREVNGDAPAAAIGVAETLRRAVIGLLPSLRRWILWAVSASLGLLLVLVPVIGPVLVIIAQTALASLFLAHSAITENRDRLGLPRRLLLREPMAVVGLALACAPLVLVPLALLFAGGTVQIAGALVALGLHRRAQNETQVGALA